VHLYTKRKNGLADEVAIPDTAAGDHGAAKPDGVIHRASLDRHLTIGLPAMAPIKRGFLTTSLSELSSLDGIPVNLE
jgi:hypothetical protein